MSAHVLLNLLNELGKRDKMRGLSSILSLFHNEFNRFNNTRARMSDCIYHMTNTLILDELTCYTKQTRTSDGGNGNHSVSLPIILIKIKVDQMLPSSYISSLLVSIL